MVKYLFNGKIQIFTNKTFFLGIELNGKEKYGDLSMYDTTLGLGYLYICW